MPMRLTEDTLATARRLRHHMTNAETLMWQILRNRAFLNVKFRRQVAMGPYIADFASIPHKLIIELDGTQHEDAEQRAHDFHRDEWLREQGWRILRFKNDLILGGSEAVYAQIEEALKQR